MSAALCALHESVKQDPLPYKNLIPSFISILKQARCSLSTLCKLCTFNAMPCCIRGRPTQQQNRE